MDRSVTCIRSDKATAVLYNYRSYIVILVTLCLRAGRGSSVSSVPQVQHVRDSPRPHPAGLPIAPTWSWDKLQTFTYGTNRTCDIGELATLDCDVSGVDSETEVAWKLRYDLVMIDNSGGTYGWGVGANCTKNSTFAACNHEKSRVAREIREADPSKPVTVYRETLCHDGSAPLPIPTTLWFNPLTNKQVKMADIWFTDAAGILQPGVCDLRKTVAQDYILVHNYFGERLEFLHDSNITGMFIDSGVEMGLRSSSEVADNAKHPAPITVGTRRELFNGTCVLFKRAADMLQSVGKFLTVSLKAHYSSIDETGGGTSGGIICDPSEPDSKIYNFTASRKNCYDEQWCDCFPYGEDVLAEIMGDTWGGSNGTFVPFREYNIPSRDFGKGDSKTMDPATLKLAQARGCAAAIIDHAIEARRGSTIACNNDGAPGLVNGSAGFGPGPYGNLTYLEQHRISLAAFMLGMEAGSYFGSGLHWTDSGWHYWFPEYDRPLGKPKGLFTRQGFVFRRSFEHVDVMANCETLETTFDWHA